MRARDPRFSSGELLLQRTACLALFVAILSSTALAQPRTATVKTTCRSIFFYPFSAHIPGVGWVDNYVTTYDGSSGFPLAEPVDDTTLIYSGELRPRPNNLSSYQADYITYDAFSAVQYGYFIANLPSTDSDANGLPDLIQRNKGITAPLSGFVRRQWPSPNSATLGGSLTRSAGSLVGRFSISVRNSTGTLSYKGRWRIPYASGTVTYDSGANSMQFNLTVEDAVGFRTASGAVTFIPVDANTLQFPTFTLSDNQGQTYTVLPFLLKRKGSRYTARVQVADGGFQTSWPDYINWFLEIKDRNDSDGDGLPDLSDPQAN